MIDFNEVQDCCIHVERKQSGLISRPFAPFHTSLDGIQQHDLLLKMRFSVLKLQFLL